MNCAHSQPCIKLICRACFHSVYSSLPSFTSVCFASLAASAWLPVELPLCIVMAGFVWAGPTPLSTRLMENMYRGRKDRVAQLVHVQRRSGRTCRCSASFHNNCDRLGSEMQSGVSCRMEPQLLCCLYGDTSGPSWFRLMSSRVFCPLFTLCIYVNL